MKVKKVSPKSTKLLKEKQLAIIKRKKKDLSKVTTKEFFGQNFHDIDNDTDNDNYDENYEKHENYDKNNGMI